MTKRNNTFVGRCLYAAGRLRTLVEMADLFCLYLSKGDEESAMDCLGAFYEEIAYPEDERASLDDPGWDVTAMRQMAAGIVFRAFEFTQEADR